MLRELVFFFFSFFYSFFVGDAMESKVPDEPLYQDVPTLQQIAALRVAFSKVLLGANSELLTYPPEVKDKVVSIIANHRIKKDLFPVELTTHQAMRQLPEGICALEGISDEGKVIILGCNGKILFCNDNDLVPKHIIAVEWRPYSSCSIPLKKKLLVGGMNGKITVFDYQKMMTDTEVRAHEGAINGLALCPNGHYVASCSTNADVKIWDSNQGQELCHLKDHKKSVVNAFITPLDAIVSASVDGIIKQWDFEQKKVIASYVAPHSLTRMACLDPHTVATGHGKISLWDLRAAKRVGLLTGHGGSISSMVCDPDERHLVTGSWSGSVKMWDLRMMASVAIMRGHADWVQRIATLHNMKKIVSGSRNGLVKLWDVSPMRTLDLDKLTLAESIELAEVVPTLDLNNSKKRLALLKEYARGQQDQD